MITTCLEQQGASHASTSVVLALCCILQSMHLTQFPIKTAGRSLKDTSRDWSKLWADVMLTIPEGALLALLILGDNWMTSLGKKHEVLDSVYPCQNCPLSKLASSTASQSQSELSSKASQPISNFQLTTLSSTLAGHHSKNS